MTHISDRKSFYTLALRDRLPVASIDFPTQTRACSIEFFSTPLGIILKINIDENSTLHTIKAYDRKRGNFEKYKLFISDDLVRLDDGSLITITQKMQIEDIVGRDFLIKIDESNIIARAQMLPRHTFLVDKAASLVYN